MKWWENPDVSKSTTNDKKNWWEDPLESTPKESKIIPPKPKISNQLHGFDLDNLLMDHDKLNGLQEKTKARTGWDKEDSTKYSVHEFATFIKNNDGDGLKKKYGFDLDKLKQDEKAFNQALSDVVNYDFTKLKRWNTIKDNAEKGNGFTKFFDKISQTGASLVMGEKVPEHYKITSGNKAADIGADIVGSIGGFATPVAGGESLLSAGTKASQGLIPKVATKVTNPAVRKAINSPLGHRIIEGGIAGSVVDVGQGIKEGDSPIELGKRTLEGAAFGAGLDIAGYGLGKLAKNVLKRFGNAPKEVIESINKVEEVKANPSKNMDQEYTEALNKIKEFYGTDDVLDAMNDYEVATAIKRDLDIDVSKLKPKESKLTPDITPKTTKSVMPEVKARDEVAITSTPLKVEAPQSETLETPLKRRKLDLSAEKSDITSDTMRKRIQENPQYYNPDTMEAQQQVAKELIDVDFEGARTLLLDGDRFSSKAEAAMGAEVYKRLQSQGRFDDADLIRQAVSKKAVKAGQEVQIQRLWSSSTPEGMVASLEKEFDKVNEGLKKNKVKLTNEDKQSILDEMNVINQMEDGYEKDFATAVLMGKYTDRIPVSLGRKVSTYQAISHLFNFATTARNIIGNTTFSAVEAVSNAWAVPFDIWRSTKTGKRTVSLPSFKEPLKEGLERAKKSAREVKAGVNVSGKGKYELYSGQTFKSSSNNIIERGLAKVEKGLGYTLKVPDEFYKGYREKQALNQMTKLAGLEKPTTDMIDQAAHEAKYATFQDDTLLGTLLQGGKELLNKIPLGKLSGNKIPGTTLKQTREFGVGDLVIKYTRVPGALIHRAIEYTPVGAAKALLNMNDAKMAGIAQREISLALGRGMTGTSIIAFGAWLKHKGLILSEDKDKDQDAKALERAEGLGNYKVNISGLQRALMGKSTERQPEDTLKSYSWCQPISNALAMGAVVSDAFKKDFTGGQTLTEIGNRSIEQVLDLPTMYVINKMFYESMKSDSTPLTIATVPAAESVSGFVPSVVRQFSNYTDPVIRDTKGETPIDTGIKKVKSVIPGVRKSLQPKIDPLGREIKRKEGLVPNLLDPATTTTYKPYSITPKLKALEEKTGESSFYPDSKPIKDFTHRKEKIELTEKERTEFQRRAGQLTKESYERILDGRDISSMSDTARDALVKRLENAKKKARNKAKMEILKKRGK